MKYHLYLIILSFVHALGSNYSKIAKENFNSVANSILGKVEALPWFYRYPFILLSFFFDILLSRRGTRFCYQTEDKRAQSFKWFKNQNISFIQDYLKFYKNLTSFIIRSHEKT